MKASRFIFSLIITVLFTCNNDDDVIDPEEEEVSSSAYFKMTRPLRGDYILTGVGRNSHSGVLVEGIVCDSVNEVIDVKINGTSIPVNNNQSECSLFSTEIPGKWGLNTIVGQIVNDQEDEVTVAQSNIISSEYFSPLENNNPPTSMIIRVGQDLIDDGDRTDIDDLATVLNKALNYQLDSAGVDELFPSVIFNSLTSTQYECGVCPCLDGFETQECDGTPCLDNFGNDCIGATCNYPNVLNGIKIEKNGPIDNLRIRTSAILEEGKLTVGAELRNLIFPFKVNIWRDRQCRDNWDWHPKGEMGFKRFEVKLIYDFNSNGSGGVDLVLEDIKVTTKFQFDVDWINIDNQYINDYEDDLNEGVEFGLNELLSGFIPDILDNLGLVCFFDGSITNINLSDGTDSSSPVPEVDCSTFSVIDVLNGYLDFSGNIPNIPPTTLSGIGLIVEAKTSRVNIGNGYLDYFLDINVLPENIMKDKGLVALRPGSTSPNFDEMPGTFGIGLKHDFINQILWALWAGGRFDENIDTSDIMEELNQDEELQSQGLKITSIETESPPVVMTDDDPNPLVEFGVGNIKMTAEKTTEVTQENPFTGQSVTFTQMSEFDIYVETTFNADIEFDTNKNQLLFIFENQGGR